MSILEVKSNATLTAVIEKSTMRRVFENFIAKAKQSKNIENFARKAKFVKSANILANVGISSFLLAGVLPAATYKFIKLTTGSYSDPGLVQNKK